MTKLQLPKQGGRHTSPETPTRLTSTNLIASSSRSAIMLSARPLTRCTPALRGRKS
jgi:hypothetical protein